MLCVRETCTHLALAARNNPDHFQKRACMDCIYADRKPESPWKSLAEWLWYIILVGISKSSQDFGDMLPRSAMLKISYQWQHCRKSRYSNRCTWKSIHPPSPSMRLPSDSWELRLPIPPPQSQLFTGQSERAIISWSSGVVECSTNREPKFSTRMNPRFMGRTRTPHQLVHLVIIDRGPVDVVNTIEDLSERQSYFGIMNFQCQAGST